MRRLRTALPAAVAAATAALVLVAGPAVAHGGKPSPRPPTVTDVATGLVTPLSLAVGPRGTTYVTQNFAGLLTAVGRDGTPTVLYASPDGGEVGGVSFDGRRITFTETQLGEEGPVASEVSTLQTDRQGNPTGAPVVLADTFAYEQANNPDGGVTYGLRDTDPACVAQVPASPVPPRYTGIADSHPYATTSSRGTTYVADAGANAILSVSDRGRVRTVAVLPAQPAVVTAEAAAGLGWPACVVGQNGLVRARPDGRRGGPARRALRDDAPRRARGREPRRARRGVHGRSLARRGAPARLRVPRSDQPRRVRRRHGLRRRAVRREDLAGRQARAEHPRRGPAPRGPEWDGKGLLATTNALPADETTPPDGHLVRIDLGRHGGR